MQWTNTGDQGFGTFYWLNSTYCINHSVPTALETYKSYLPESAKLEDSMTHWDEIEVNHKKIIYWKEVCRTVLPNEPDIIADPNDCKLILMPVDYSKMKHYQILAKGSSSSLSLTTISLHISTSKNILQLLIHQLNHYRVLFQRGAPMYKLVLSYPLLQKTL